MTKAVRFGALALLINLLHPASSVLAQTKKTELVQPKTGKYGLSGDAQKGSWTFAVSGDSRNCGDVVMPAIAAGVKKEAAQFYWHLGDLRRISDIDEDIAHRPASLAKPLSMTEYEAMAWGDFIQSQVVPFGKLPVYLGIGNHETTPPKTREQFVSVFENLLDRPDLRSQRLRDDPNAIGPRSYFRWIKGAIDFINLDNATADQFDAEQLRWFEAALRSDATDARVRTVVVGMHEALPDSLSEDHSMAQSSQGVVSGRRVYGDLLDFQKKGKRVYVLASHSHYFMEGTYNTAYWREHGGVLSGWIIGTAGAVRYALPAGWVGAARYAETNVYGFMTGTVRANGSIDFRFHRLTEADIPAPVADEYTPAFVHWCFAENSQVR